MQLDIFLSLLFIKTALAVTYPKSFDKPIPFDEYVRLYAKHYKSDAEYEHRKEVFEENMKLLISHNEKNDKGILTHRIGINQFSDLTLEERQAKNGLPQVSGIHHTENEDYIIKLRQKYENFNFPKNFSWVEKGNIEIFSVLLAESF